MAALHIPAYDRALRRLQEGVPFRVQEPPNGTVHNVTLAQHGIPVTCSGHVLVRGRRLASRVARQLRLPSHHVPSQLWTVVAGPPSAAPASPRRGPGRPAGSASGFGKSNLYKDLEDGSPPLRKQPKPKPKPEAEAEPEPEAEATGSEVRGWRHGELPLGGLRPETQRQQPVPGTVARASCVWVPALGGGLGGGFRIKPELGAPGRTTLLQTGAGAMPAGVLEAPAEAEGQVRFAGARLDLKPSQSRPASDTPGTRSR